jgi:hypothetical protein
MLAGNPLRIIESERAWGYRKSEVRVEDLALRFGGIDRKRQQRERWPAGIGLSLCPNPRNYGACRGPLRECIRRREAERQ